MQVILYLCYHVILSQFNKDDVVWRSTDNHLAFDGQLFGVRRTIVWRSADDHLTREDSNDASAVAVP